MVGVHGHRSASSVSAGCAQMEDKYYQMTVVDIDDLEEDEQEEQERRLKVE